MLDNLIFGKLSLNAIPWDDPITLYGAGGFVAVVGVLVISLLTYYKKWSYVWNDWICSVDHKKIGIMYLFLAGLMFYAGHYSSHYDALATSCGSRWSYGVSSS